MSWISRGSSALSRAFKMDAFTQSRSFTTTQILYAEPLRKKRRLDPAILKVRIERKIFRAERELERLLGEPKQLIPIKEYCLTNSEKRDLLSRPERSDDCKVDKGTILAAQRLWSLYRLEEDLIQRRSIRRVECSQRRTLEILKAMDEKLYDNTVATDDYTLIPYSSCHIRKETCPNPDYVPPDGYIKDTTKEWIM